MGVRFTPEMFIAYYVAQRGIAKEDIGVAPVCVLAWSDRVLRNLVDRLGARRAEHWMYPESNPLYCGAAEGHPVSVLDAPIGAPGTVMMMEEMIACGARVFVGVGLAGSLQPTAPVGTILIPTDCRREEGTSAHYLRDDDIVEAAPRLVGPLRDAFERHDIRVVSGPHWTTDAPYRELVSKIEAYRRQGVVSVDMETSAMYALGKFRGVEVCNVLVVSDELWRAWKPAFRSSRLEEAAERVASVLVKCLGQGLA